MVESAVATQLEDFAECLKANEPLARYTCLRIGGPAEALVLPRSRPELAAVVRRCAQHHIPLRVLGSGGRILVRDEGVRGVVLRLREPAFAEVEVEGRLVRAGGGASLSSLISQAARHGLAGLEGLVGTLGTVGGLLCQPDGAGEVGQYVRRAVVLDAGGTEQVRERDELRLAEQERILDDAVLLSAELELETDDADAIVRRLRKAWIQRKARRPMSFQAAVRAFKDPRGPGAAELITQAGLAGTRVGGAEVSDRDASFIVAGPQTTARDVLRLIDLVRSRVRERFQVELELALSVW